MLTSEQLKAVRKIHIRTSHLVNDVFAGQYQSAFRGRGMEFAEVRQYCPGDDVRTIDWNVTARTGIPHVKRFSGERELTVMLVVDASASTRFGTVSQLKSTMAAEMAALFAFSAITNNDKVGLVIFSHAVELSLPPKRASATSCGSFVRCSPSRASSPARISRPPWNISIVSVSAGRWFFSFPIGSTHTPPLRSPLPIVAMTLLPLC